MKKLLMAAVLWGLAPCAHAQLTSVDVQVQPQAGEKFWLRVNYPCPPPDAAPPPQYCNGGVGARIVTSDPKAQKPGTATLFVSPNRPFVIGPFKFQNPGTGYVELRSTDGSDALVAVAQFEVQPRR